MHDGVTETVGVADLMRPQLEELLSWATVSFNFIFPSPLLSPPPILPPSYTLLPPSLSSHLELNWIQSLLLMTPNTHTYR